MFPLRRSRLRCHAVGLRFTTANHSRSPENIDPIHQAKRWASCDAYDKTGQKRREGQKSKNDDYIHQAFDKKMPDRVAGGLSNPVAGGFVAGLDLSLFVRRAAVCVRGL